MQTLKRAAIAIVATGLVNTAAAEADTLPFADELDSCVAAVTEHLDLSDASRVRHTVVEKRRSGLGHALSIETSVFTGAAERRYSAYCVATGAGTPLKFRINEKAG